MSEQVEDVIMSQSGDCVDLRATFGDRFKIVRGESYHAERPEFRVAEAAWLAIIPCRFWHIYPHGRRLLAVHTESHSRRKLLQSLDGVRVRVDCDRETTAVFDVSVFERVGQIVQPRRRGRLSAGQRAASIKRLAAFQFRPGIIARHYGFGGRTRNEKKLDDPNYIPPAEVA